jgi:hypothetical protein
MEPNRSRGRRCVLLGGGELQKKGRPTWGGWRPGEAAQGTPQQGRDGRIWGKEALGEQGLGELDLACSWTAWGRAFCA